MWLSSTVVSYMWYSSSLNSDEILQAPNTETVIASTIPFPCGRFPSVAANIRSKHFSVSSQMSMTLFVGLYSLAQSFNFRNSVVGALCSEPRALEQAQQRICFSTFLATYPAMYEIEAFLNSDNFETLGESQ